MPVDRIEELRAQFSTATGQRSGRVATFALSECASSYRRSLIKTCQVLGGGHGARREDTHLDLRGAAPEPDQLGDGALEREKIRVARDRPAAERTATKATVGQRNWSWLARVLPLPDVPAQIVHPLRAKEGRLARRHRPHWHGRPRAMIAAVARVRQVRAAKRIRVVRPARNARVEPPAKAPIRVVNRGVRSPSCPLDTPAETLTHGKAICSSVAPIDTDLRMVIAVRLTSVAHAVRVRCETRIPLPAICGL